MVVLFAPIVCLHTLLDIALLQASQRKSTTLMGTMGKQVGNIGLRWFPLLDEMRIDDSAHLHARGHVWFDERS